MKAIIQGKRFDTSKSIKIGEICYGDANDVDGFEEGLYKTPRSGVFFLAGQGGARTRYANQSGPAQWTSGKRIIPLSAEEALKWAEENLTAAEIEAGFGDVIQDA